MLFMIVALLTVPFVMAAIKIVEKLMAVNPNDAISQDSWHRLKRKIKCGKLYHLFAMRTKERKKIYVLHLLAGIFFLVAVSHSFEYISRTYIPIEQLKEVRGKLVDFHQTNNKYGLLSIQTSQGIIRYPLRFNLSEANRIKMTTGMQISAWVLPGKIFESDEVKQIKNNGNVILQYPLAQSNREEFERVRWNIWLYGGMPFFIFSIFVYWVIARINNNEYGVFRAKVHA